MSDNKTKLLYDALVFDKLPAGAVLSEQVDKQAQLIAATWYGEEMRLLKDEIEGLQIKLFVTNLKIASLEKVINDGAQ